METHPTPIPPATERERIVLDPTFGGKKRGFAAFLICCALLLAAFAVSALWLGGGGEDWFRPTSDALPPTTTDGEGTRAPVTEAPDDTKTPSEIPEGATRIRTADLSYLSLGRSYIHNETFYRPDVDALLAATHTWQSDSEDPLVLILHSHTSESYLPSGCEYVEGTLGDVTYSEDGAVGVLSVGEVLAQTLNEQGIPTLHCTVRHDEAGHAGSYERSAETVKRYLAEYPSIRLVIDLHRDAVMSSDGEAIRAAVSVDGLPTAQVMAVVGSDANGTSHPGWEQNLSLALQLRECLNATGEGLCRPVSLRCASFYQELSPASLLLEIGTAANSPEEAKRAAVLVGNALAELLHAR